MTRLNRGGGVLLLVFAYGCSGTPTSPSVARASPVTPATVGSPVVASSIPGSTDNGCAWQRRPKINPGSTWDMDTLGYCTPEVALHKSVDTYVSSVALDVTYEDDFGRIGSLRVVIATN